MSTREIEKDDDDIIPYNIGKKHSNIFSLALVLEEDEDEFSIILKKDILEWNPPPMDDLLEKYQEEDFLDEQSICEVMASLFSYGNMLDRLLYEKLKSLYKRRDCDEEKKKDLVSSFFIRYEEAISPYLDLCKKFNDKVVSFMENKIDESIKNPKEGSWLILLSDEERKGIWKRILQHFIRSLYSEKVSSNKIFDYRKIMRNASSFLSTMHELFSDGFYICSQPTIEGIKEETLRERNERNRSLTLDGLQKARERGVSFGRKILEKPKEFHTYFLKIEQKEMSQREVAKKFNVSRPTVYRWMKEEKESQQ